MTALLAVAALASAAVGTAFAYWTGTSGQPQLGTGAGAAASVNQGSTPTVTRQGASNVLVNWTASTMSNGGAVGAYLVKRYDADTDASQTVLSSCAGTITATSCTETGVPAGDWKYAVTPTVGSNWRGAESAKSAIVTTSTTALDFLQPITSPEAARPGPAGMATGDIDNDGDPDIVMGNLFDNASSVFVNNGVGDFTEHLVISNAASIDAGLGNFDNDSNLDLALLYPGTPPATGLLVVFKGDGAGNFTYQYATNELVATGVSPTQLAVGNFNGDAIDDVAVVNAQSDPNTQAGTVMTFLGNPAGNDTFSSATPAQTLSTQVGATDIAFADFNGGASDLVVTNYVSNSITFLAGNGTGFNAPSNVAAGAPVLYMDVSNLNAGTNKDIVATVRNSNPSAVRTLFGDGAGAFPTQATTTTTGAGTGALPQMVVAEDLEGDGDQDLGVANGDPNSVSVLANNGSGAFTPAPTSPETGIGGAATVPYGIISADFDASGFNDLAVTPVFTSPSEVPILLNQSGNRANLSITLTDSPDPVNTGQDLTYTLTVSNANASTPSSVKATDTLPAGTTFNAAASSPSCSAVTLLVVTVTCNYGSVAKGSPESQSVVVTTGASTPASITNTATVAGNLADPIPANNTSTTTTSVTDTQPPAQAFSLNSPVGAFLNATTLYYKGNAVGSFKLIDTVTDSGSGPASATFPVVGTAGWTHAAETVTTPAGGPYTSTSFSWTANPTNPTGYTVTAKDVANNTASAPLTFVSDTTAPTGGGISYPNDIVETLSVPITITNPTDSQSGVNAGSGLVKRAQATLNTVTNKCGTFGGYTTNITLAGGADTSVTSGTCYMYQGLISDYVGNQATLSSTSVARVDTTGPLLGNAGIFAVLGATTVTNAGSTVINGDLGISPGTACTGFRAPCTGVASGTVNGDIHSADSAATQAQAAVTTAYNKVVAEPVTATISSLLGGTTRGPGVYDSALGTFVIGGTLTLDGQGDPNSVFIFKTATTLNTVAALGNVVLINGARSCNVFWKVGSSADLPLGTLLRGSVLAFTAVTTSGATVDGRLLARGASVTLASNTVTVPPVTCP